MSKASYILGADASYGNGFHGCLEILRTQK